MFVGNWMQTVVIQLWRKRVKKGSYSCQNNLLVASEANATAAAGNVLQLNITPHHPHAISPLTCQQGWSCTPSSPCTDS